MSDFIKLTETYKQRCVQFCFDNGYHNSPNHIINIMISIMMTRDNVLSGGSFVKAVVDNRLYEAINYADRECYEYLKLLVLTNRNCFINEEF